MDSTTLISNRPPGRSAIGTDGLPGPGATLAGKYELVRVLGRGGMGVVMEARDLRLDRRVAIKMISSARRTPGLVVRFEREARAAARLQSPHAVRLLDVGVAEPALPFMVMEYLEGRGLDAELAERGPLPAAEAVGYVLEACEAMAEAHAAGIIHRDLKPSNLFLCSSGGRRTIKVLDFGISKLTGEGERAITTTQSSGFGTPEYMSPEQVRSNAPVDERSDIWSLGVVLYQLLSGATPFRGDAAPAVFVAIATDTPPPLRPLRADIPIGLELVLSRALRKNPRERYPSALAFAEALAPFADLPPRSVSRTAAGAGPESSVAHVFTRPRLPSGVASGDTGRRPGQRAALLATLAFASAAFGITAWFGRGAGHVPLNTGEPDQTTLAQPVEPAPSASPPALDEPAPANPAASPNATAKAPPEGKPRSRPPGKAGPHRPRLRTAPDGHPVRF